jgi:hypothetical protein
VVVEDFRNGVTAGREYATGRSEAQPVCDICGTQVKRALDASDRCPKCQTGTFRLHNIWQS